MKASRAGRFAGAVLIDYPGFHLRLGRALRRTGIPVLQYVAPQLWAWRAGRLARLREAADESRRCCRSRSSGSASGGSVATYRRTPGGRSDLALARRGPRPAWNHQPGTGPGYLSGQPSREIERHWPLFREVAFRLLAEGHCRHVIVAGTPAGYYPDPGPCQVHHGCPGLVLAAADGAPDQVGHATLEAAWSGPRWSSRTGCSRLTYELARRLMTVRLDQPGQPGRWARRGAGILAPTGAAAPVADALRRSSTRQSVAATGASARGWRRSATGSAAGDRGAGRGRSLLSRSARVLSDRWARRSRARWRGPGASRSSRPGSWLERDGSSGRPYVLLCWHEALLPLMWHHRDQRHRRRGQRGARRPVPRRLRRVAGVPADPGLEHAAGDAGPCGLPSGRCGQGIACGRHPGRAPGPAAGRQAGGIRRGRARRGALVVPVHAEAGRPGGPASWDRFLLPEPFARVRIAYGEPFDASALGDPAGHRGPGLAARLDDGSEAGGMARRRGDTHRLIRWLWTSRRLDARLARLALLPVAGLWRGWHGARRELPTAAAGCRSHDLPLPSVAVGNLTVGGSGKTPIAIWIARYYAERGLVPGILLRGYGAGRGAGAPARRARTPMWWPIRTGWRAPSGPWPAGRTVLVLDDAYQRLDVRRDLNILVVSAETTRAVRWPLPAGPWREGWQALDRADAVVVTRKRATPRGREALAARSARPDPRPGGHRPPRAAPSRGAGVRHGAAPGRVAGRQRVVAASAIADPDAFVAQTKATGAAVQVATWKDHHELPRRGRRLAGARGAAGRSRGDHGEGRRQAPRPLARRRAGAAGGGAGPHVGGAAAMHSPWRWTPSSRRPSACNDHLEML